MRFVSTRPWRLAALGIWAGLALALSTPMPVVRASAPPDPIETEIGRWLTILKTDTRTDELWAYRPPASIARHADFIAASGTLRQKITPGVILRR